MKRYSTHRGWELTSLKDVVGSVRAMSLQAASYRCESWIFWPKNLYANSAMADLHNGNSESRSYGWTHHGNYNALTSGHPFHPCLLSFPFGSPPPPLSPTPQPQFSFRGRVYQTPAQGWLNSREISKVCNCRRYYDGISKQTPKLRTAKCECKKAHHNYSDRGRWDYELS